MLVATLSLLACLSAASPTTVRVNIVVTTQVPSVEVFVRALDDHTPDDGPPWEWLGKVQQQRFSSYSLPSTSTLRIQSLWDNSNEGSSNTTKVEYHPKHRDVDLSSTQGKDTLNLAIGKHDLIDNDNGEVLEWWPLNGTATTVLGNTDHSDQLFRARFEVEDLGEKVGAWREGCEDDEFVCARPDRNFVMAKLILKESMWSAAQQEIVDRTLQDSRIAHTKYPRFTNNGYKRSKVSFALRKDITAWYASSRQAARPEEMPLVSGGVAAAESDTWMLTLPDDLHARVRRECMASLYKWIRRTHVLEFTALYGVRIYREGSVLHVHTDRPMTHILSCILNVRSTGPQWPLIIQGFKDEFEEVVLEEGELLLYESASSPHGRVGRLGRGGEVANVFIHFKPQGWPQVFLGDESVRRSEL
ncbi:hypothetical protein FOZ62_025499 [Perkinsus olseni]|uniref:Prolyl 4-hydroxylase alpha subunit domain-containing protein n=1 Tax=Perkinsus olseni TaxID=32597 RepID=A0A7J6QWN0_PEROL|nr:hypothetical protein FOZ62_025499 [Perkinsus olseni]